MQRQEGKSISCVLLPVSRTKGREGGFCWAVRREQRSGKSVFSTMFYLLFRLSAVLPRVVPSAHASAGVFRWGASEIFTLSCGVVVDKPNPFYHPRWGFWISSRADCGLDCSLQYTGIPRLLCVLVDSAFEWLQKLGCQKANCRAAASDEPLCVLPHKFWSSVHPGTSCFGGFVFWMSLN